MFVCDKWKQGKSFPSSVVIAQAKSMKENYVIDRETYLNI